MSIFIDLEMNTTDARLVYKKDLRNEIIEIGAVRMDDAFHPLDRFRIFVRPQYNGVIERKIYKLTGISNGAVSDAVSLPEALGALEAWCGSDGCEIWKFLDQWREGKGQEVEGHLDYEVEGIHEILRNCSMLSVRMGGIYVDDQLEAFSIGSYNNKEKMAIIHIEKANPEMRGLYQMINQQFLVHEFPEAEIVNREDDMGLPGLRQAKMSYAPMDFARKYRIKQLDFEAQSAE